MTDARLPLPVTPRLALAAAAGSLLGAAVCGYLLGRAHDDVREVVGTAHSAENAISIETDDWTYGVPLDVVWYDGTGARHTGGRPACLPPSRQVIEGIRFAAVPVEVHGGYHRQVVTVFCP
jgi:hypothetical protein